MRLVPLITTFTIALLFGLLGCEKDNGRKAGVRQTDSTDSTGDSGNTDSSKPEGIDTGTIDTVNMPEGCGDGILGDKEACDDKNHANGDGCTGDCLHVEDGWSCNPPGMPCHRMAICGDADVLTPELCDDGNAIDGDGCSKRCKVEIGWACEGSPSVCRPTTCGDGIQEGAESCDDGNTTPFDGCDTRCQQEPDCTSGACASECGDGLVLGEECDDGNLLDGDGCSSICTIEDGYTCPLEGCEDDETCTLTVSAIFRDFQDTHSDFGGACDGLATGMVQPTLGSDWKPVGTGMGCNVTNFKDWYTTPPSKVGEIILYPDGAGNFVNRYGANGEPWLAPPEVTKCADGPTIKEGSYMQDLCVDDCSQFTQQQKLQECQVVQAALAANPGFTCASPCPDDYANRTCIVGPKPTCDQCSDYGTPEFVCLDPCGTSGAGFTKWDLCQQSSGAYDGNPLFFPVDDLGAYAPAKIPEQYGYNGWPWEEDILGTATLHNFSFTTEVTYWFKFDAATPATLNFTGDDDVWVFVNGQLAVDLGGVHVPLDGSVTINAQNNFGMEDGKVYRINIFHAERKQEGSSFRLTLGGFNTARSECFAECGDGIISLGEQCDDGVNDGGYGECAEGCVLGEYCGDGVVQEEFEDCDDGNFRSGDACPSSCREIGII